jgi:outer membrane protein OmpA-like peptidoglycan-associated protein
MYAFYGPIGNTAGRTIDFEEIIAMDNRFKKPLGRAVVCVLAMLMFSSVAWGSGSEASPPPPTTTLQAVRGMAHTVSAEPLGAGRLTFSLLGSWYQQANAFPGVPPEGSNLLTGLGGFSFGASQYIDLFAVLPVYCLLRPDENASLGLGSLATGVLGSLPLPRKSPIRLGAQLSIIAGSSGDQINTNREDGYNYLETRTGFDFMGKFMESLVLGSESGGFKLHLNEGLVAPLGSDHSSLLLLSAGMQGVLHRMLVLGFEVNSRTRLDEIDFAHDALWITPCITFRIPSHASIVFGADISLSQERDAPADSAALALEPYRLFGGFVFSFDALARKRKAAADREHAQTLEKDDAVRRASESQARADSLARKAHEDSLASASARAAEQLRADSLMRKMREDSVALADTKLRLADEISKRSDAEKQLLSTGMLILDAVYFETGKAVISLNSRPYLKIIAKMLTKYPKLQVEIAGHTDNTGKLQTNIDLSQARALAVRLFLLQVAPELADRVVAHGYGPSQPKAENTTAAGRKVNRRVELQVLNKEVLKDYNP